MPDCDTLVPGAVDATGFRGEDQLAVVGSCELANEGLSLVDCDLSGLSGDGTGGEAAGVIGRERGGLIIGALFGKAEGVERVLGCCSLGSLVEATVRRSPSCSIFLFLGLKIGFT